MSSRGQESSAFASVGLFLLLAIGMILYLDIVSATLLMGLATLLLAYWWKKQ